MSERIRGDAGGGGKGGSRQAGTHSLIDFDRHLNGDGGGGVNTVFGEKVRPRDQLEGLAVEILM